MQFFVGVEWDNACRKSVLNSLVELGQPITLLKLHILNIGRRLYLYLVIGKCGNDTSSHSIAHKM